MYVCICIYNKMHIYEHIYVCIHIVIRTHARTHTHTHVRTRTHTRANPYRLETKKREQTPWTLAAGDPEEGYTYIYIYKYT